MPASGTKLPDFHAARVLVVGDVMLDRYWSGPTTRISPEAPVPVVRIRRIEDRAGGAANVALGARALGAQASIVGCVGADEAAGVLQGLLQARGVQCHLAARAQASTIVKLRVLSQHQQMIRLDFEEHPSDPSAALLLPEVQPWVAAHDVVVLSDYGKGALSNCRALIGAIRDMGKPVLVDPKQPDFSVYAGASVLTPNRQEFERAVGACFNDTELAERGMQLLQRLGFEALLITRGEEGMTLLARDQAPLHIAARAKEVYDVTGAGDTVIAVMAAAVAAGQSWRAAAEWANLAAAVAVGKLGTATVSASELAQALAEH
jgi:D-beta-D-heptose 7-phosphate kinase / D-beta-D-heptose 1-phosphate adenosyltransferase